MSKGSLDSLLSVHEFQRFQKSVNRKPTPFLKSRTTSFDSGSSIQSAIPMIWVWNAAPSNEKRAAKCSAEVYWCQRAMHEARMSNTERSKLAARLEVTRRSADKNRFLLIRCLVRSRPLLSSIDDKVRSRRNLVRVHDFVMWYLIVKGCPRQGCAGRSN